jgi:putative SOS response-associated peptidase YedK
MCGRFAFDATADEAQQSFSGFIFPADMSPRYNIAPGQPVLALTGENRADYFKWGLVPSWAKDIKIGNKMINARAETLAEKPAFRNAFKKRRCLIPATGFYEWQKQPDGKTKVPMHIHLLSGQPFAMAGLWETWQSTDGQKIQTCTVITTEPNALMQPIHNRMPVILPPETYATWLDSEEQSADVLNDLLKPYPAVSMTAHPVSTLINNPNNDTPECLNPAAPIEQRALF